MNGRREFLTGILAVIISITIIGGSFALATTEVRSSIAMNIITSPTLTSFPTQIIMVTQRPGEPTYTPSPTIIPTTRPTDLPPSFTPTKAIVSCSPPSGWSSIVLQPGDTLESLAQSYKTTPKELKEANCLVGGDNLISGTIFYVPGAPPPTPIPCGPPAGWVYYVVQKGDNLFRIGQIFGVSVAQLQVANCLGSSDKIRVGQKLYVPNVPPIIPSSTPSLTVTSSPEPSTTSTPIPPSKTPTVELPLASQTSVPTTITPQIPTETLAPTDTPILPTLTFTSTPSPEPTSTPTDIPTSTIPPTITPFPTLIPTLTDTSSP